MEDADEAPPATKSPERSSTGGSIPASHGDLVEQTTLTLPEDRRGSTVLLSQDQLLSMTRSRSGDSDEDGDEESEEAEDASAYASISAAAPQPPPDPDTAAKRRYLQSSSTATTASRRTEPPQQRGTQDEKTVARGNRDTSNVQQQRQDDETELITPGATRVGGMGGMASSDGGSPAASVDETVEETLLSPTELLFAASLGSSHNNEITTATAVSRDELEAQIRRQVLSEAVIAEQVVVEIDKENEQAPMSIEQGGDSPSLAKSPPFLRKWGWIMACLVVWTAVVAGLVVGLLGSLGNDGSGSGSSSDSPDSTAITENYTPQDAAELRNLLATKSPLVQVQGSAQNEAYRWMVTNQIMQTHEFVWETYALVTLYYATGGSSEWTNSDGWLEHDISICDWYPGGLCDIQGQGRGTGGRQRLRGLQQQQQPQQGGGGQGGQYSGNGAPPIRIRSLALQDNNLNGKLPDEITLLTDLQELVLDMNPLLVGTIPSSISSLQNLRLFSAKFVGLSGTFPSELGELEQLRVFDMEGATSMRDAPFPIDLWTLPRLKTLNLDNIGLTGTLPDTLLSPVEASLQKNRLSGTIPNTLSSYSWSSLVLLDLRDNELTGSIPDSLANLWNEDLLVLRLEGNELTGAVGSSVCDAFTASVDATGDVHVFTSDCSGEVQVTCSCCTICCLDGDQCQDNRRK